MITENDLRNYTYNANQEMKRLRMIPRSERSKYCCIYCTIDDRGFISWNSYNVRNVVYI